MTLRQLLCFCLVASFLIQACKPIQPSEASTHAIAENNALPPDKVIDLVNVYLHTKTDMQSTARQLANGHEVQYDDLNGSYVFNPDPKYFSDGRMYVATEQDSANANKGLTINLAPSVSFTLSQLETLFGHHEDEIHTGQQVFFVKFPVYTHQDFAFSGVVHADLGADSSNPDAKVAALVITRVAQ